MSLRHLLNARFQAFVLALLCLVQTGCEQSLSTDYGKSRGYTGDSSINGFGALRRTFQIRGWLTRDVARLNSRLAGLDAVVWMPTQRDTLYDDALQWFNDWLAESPRTLVYIAPDGGCEVEYFEIARTMAPPSQQLEYRRHIARLQTNALLERMNQSSIPANGWFMLEYIAPDMKVGGKKGEWNQDLVITTAEQSEVSCPIHLDYKVVDLSSAQANAATAITSSTINTSPASPSPSPSGTPINVTPWGKALGKSSVDVQHETLLSAENGSPAIARLTSDAWGESKVIVIGNGSLLTNFSLSTPFGRELAAKLLQEVSSSTGEVGFLATDYMGATISEVDPEINAQSGMELLTVWPMSLILLNLIVIGFIACMVLLPIFGRPRETEQNAPNDFADHLDAVAALMSRSGGEEYARRRVSDYMKRIRGETVGPWVLPEPVPHAVTTFHHSPSHPPTSAAPDQSENTNAISTVSSPPAMLSTKEKS
jgi:hypothetical protein